MQYEQFATSFNLYYYVDIIYWVFFILQVNILISLSSLINFITSINPSFFFPKNFSKSSQGKFVSNLQNWLKQLFFFYKKTVK